MIFENIESKSKPSVDNKDLENYDGLIFEIEKDENKKEKENRTRNILRLEYFD
jgi:hypothetical protein